MPELIIPDRALFFPVTAFDAEDRVDVDVDLVEQHVAERIEHRPGAVFAASGTGEFHALSASEHTVTVAASVRAPLVDPSTDQVGRLERLLILGHELIE